jgi:hypothetical protein
MLETALVFPSELESAKCFEANLRSARSRLHPFTIGHDLDTFKR